MENVLHKYEEPSVTWLNSWTEWIVTKMWLHFNAFHAQKDKVKTFMIVIIVVRGNMNCTLEDSEQNEALRRLASSNDRGTRLG